MPKKDEEWRQFHEMNEEGIKTAYESKEGYYKDGKEKGEEPIKACGVERFSDK